MGADMAVHQITGLDNGRWSDDGNLVRFEANTRSGDVLALEMPTTNIGNLVAFLCGLAQEAARETRVDADSKAYEGPLIEATHLGLAEGRIKGETILSVALGPFAIGIAAPTLAIEALLQQADLDIESTKH